MESSLKRNAWCFVFLVWCFIALPANAASFDCAKASTKVEHIICDTPEISKLDEELAVRYKEALQDQSKAERVKQDQRQWMKDRNLCEDVDRIADCVKSVYEIRLSSFVSHVLHLENISGIKISPTQIKAEQISKLKEADKKELVKQIMASKVKTVDSDSVGTSRESFCTNFIKDFQRMEGFEFIEPIKRSEKFDDPTWDTYKTRCPNMGLFENYSCEPRIAMDLDELPQDEQYKKMKVVCDQYRCTENFKHFKVELKGSEGSRTEDIFYCERAHGPLNMEGVTPYDTSGGYGAIDIKRCEGMGGMLSHDPYSYEFHHSLENVNGLVVYKGKHYIFDLSEIDVKTRTPENTSYRLSVWGYDRRGDEKRTKLYPVCIYSTVIPIGQK